MKKPSEKTETERKTREIRSVAKRITVQEERLLRCPTCLTTFRIVHELPATGLSYTCPVCQQSVIATERNSVQVKVIQHEEG